MRLSSNVVSLPDPLPSLHFNVLHLTDSAIVHLSTSPNAPKLAADLACAFPLGSSTQLLKSASLADDAAKSMSQRLAKRLNIQVFLSLDIPPSDNAHLLQLKAEKAVFDHLKSEMQ
ncbi:hypothetical protein DL96DRAFT_1709840 [Flagelloscypha sp. PMI_526]|nr:hypothetical protein DL96DRAFT_1709840 [Flagelloscypha sp. PMI_526]